MAWYDGISDVVGGAVDWLFDSGSSSGGMSGGGGYSSAAEGGSQSSGSSWGGVFDTTSKALGSVWDWGTKTQAGNAFVGGAATGMLSYMSAKDAPVAGAEDRAYMEQRRSEHNAGITAAAQRYK